MPASDASGKGSRLSQYGSVRSDGVGGEELVQVRGAGAGEADDDDRRLELEVEDPGLAGEQVDEQQPVLQQLEDLAVEAEHAGGGEPRHVAQRGEQHVEALLVVAVAEVVEAGLGHRLAAQRVGVELAGGAHRRHGAEDLVDLGRELRLGQVVDVDVGHQVPPRPVPGHRGGCRFGAE